MKKAMIKIVIILRIKIIKSKILKINISIINNIKL